jgi:hypothetical protein
MFSFWSRTDINFIRSQPTQVWYEYYHYSCKSCFKTPIKCLGMSCGIYPFPAAKTGAVPTLSLSISGYPTKMETSFHRAHKDTNPKSHLVTIRVFVRNDDTQLPLLSPLLLIPRWLFFCGTLLHHIDVSMPISPEHRIMSPNLTHPKSVSAELIRHINMSQ